ncbi:uncharacterized protein TNCV_3521601 [Trichonephila clavipes]|nr:uncharacterized protein TNCV_3521601 [Trichonephila clavipes]
MSGTQSVPDLSSMDSAVPFVFRVRDLTHKGSLNIQSLRGRSFIATLSQNKLLSLRGALQQHPPKSQFFPTLSLPLYIHSLSSHPTPNHPLMFCPFAAPVGLGSLDLFFFFCRLVGLNSFDLSSLCRPRRSRHIPSLAPWAPMSGYTLYVFRRAVVTGSGVNKSTLLMRLFVTPRTQFRNSFPAQLKKSPEFSQRLSQRVRSNWGEVTGFVTILIVII